MAADDIAKGALQLIKWGKKIIPATAEEVKMYGPQAGRVKALMNMVGSLSEDARKLGYSTWARPKTDVVRDALRNAYLEIDSKALNAGRTELSRTARQDISDVVNSIKIPGADRIEYPSQFAASAEVISDLITPKSYGILTGPMSAARRFDMTVPNAPESFTNIARSLGERRLVTGPKDIEIARRVSMLPPDMQQVYLNLLGEGTDPAQLLQALRLMGQ
jgi:hypothetical protein